MSKALLACLAISLIIFPPPLSANDLQALYNDKELAQTASLKFYHAGGEVGMAGITGKVDICFVFPDKYRMEVDLGVLKLVQVYNGSQAWMIDQNGQTVELKGYEKGNLINSAFMAGYSFLRDDGIPSEIEQVDDTLINGTSYSVFKATPEGGSPVWLYHNAAAGRIEIAKEYLDEVPIFTFQSDYRNVDGFEIAFKSKTISAIPALNSEITLSEINMNEAIPDSIFYFGGNGGDDFVFPEGRDSIVVPVVYHNGHLYAKAVINGDSTRYFIFDSGASINILNKDYADEIDLETSGDFAAKGGTGYEEASIGRVDSIRLGSILIGEQSVAVTDINQVMRDFEGNSLGGILGFDLLSRYPVKIDYPGQKLIMYNPKEFSAPADYEELPLEYFMKIPVLKCRFMGYPAKFLIDLGNAHSVILHGKFLTSNKLRPQIKNLEKADYALGGIGGISEIMLGTVDSITIGNLRISDQQVLIADGEGGMLGSQEIDGNLGNGFLEKFALVLDYRAQKIYLKPLF